MHVYCYTDTLGSGLMNDGDARRGRAGRPAGGPRAVGPLVFIQQILGRPPAGPPSEFGAGRLYSS